MGRTRKIVSNHTESLLRELFKKPSMNPYRASKILKEKHNIKVSSPWVSDWKKRVLDMEAGNQNLQAFEKSDKTPVGVTTLETITKYLSILYDSADTINQMDNSPKKAETLVKVIDEIKDLHEYKNKYFGELEVKNQLKAIINGIIDISVKILTPAGLDATNRENLFRDYEEQIEKFLRNFGIETD